MQMLIGFLFLALASVPCASQSSYSGFQSRTVKALSDQQVQDLRTGRGMGLALPAELNGYPGPVHVLEHGESLKLTPQQRTTTEMLAAEMKAEAVPIGERLIEQEARLDRLFSSRQVTLATLRDTTQAIGTTQAQLREIHLKYHLAMKDLLSPTQIERYGELRGYGGEHSSSPPRHGRH